MEVFDLRGGSDLRVDFFLFHFSNDQIFWHTCLKGFVEIRKIPETIGI